MAKTLDESLDEMEKWGDRLSEKLLKLTPEKCVAYLSESLKRFEENTGIVLKQVPAPRRRRTKKTRRAKAS